MSQPPPPDKPTASSSAASVVTDRSSAMTPDGCSYMSETESDTSSVMGDVVMSDVSSNHGLPLVLPPGVMRKPVNPMSREQMQRRVESLVQENKVLKVEVDTFKLKVKNLQAENRDLRQTSVFIQARAEQEEEFISNSLMKKISELKKEKETLALNYEQEEECLTNELSKKLHRLKGEKETLAESLKKEQESLVDKLMHRIKKLEAETTSKQQHLDQVRREKVVLENTLEQEQEALVNRLWKRMDKLEGEKRYLQGKLDPPTAGASQMSAPQSPMEVQSSPSTAVRSAHLPPTVGRPPPPARPTIKPPPTDEMVRNIDKLRAECNRLKAKLDNAECEKQEREVQMSREEAENLRLRRKLELETERRNELFRHLSESESSLEMEDERVFNELSMHGAIPQVPASAGAAARTPAQHPHPTSSPVAQFGRVSPAFGNLNVAVNFAPNMIQGQQSMPIHPSSMYSSSALLNGPPSPSARWAAAHVCCHACGTPTVMAHMAAANQHQYNVLLQQWAMSAAASPTVGLARTKSSAVNQSVEGGTQQHHSQSHSRSGSSASNQSDTSRSRQAQSRESAYRNPSVHYIVAHSSSFARPANPPSAPPTPLAPPPKTRHVASARSKTPDVPHK